MYDILIIGGGIVGSFIAHDLSKYCCKTAVLEKESDVANCASMANSAIVHSGHDPKEGTLKAKLNLKGSQMYEKVCENLHVSYKRTSAFVAALSEEEEPALKEMFQQAMSRGIQAEYMDGDEARKREPNLSSQVKAVIELPTTAVIYPWEVSVALMEEAMENDVRLFLNHKVTKIEKAEDHFRVTASGEIFESKIVINAAGVYGDEIYAMAGGKENISIRPRKGEYYVLDKQKHPLVSRVIYPLPSRAGKGVLVVPTVSGNILLGPDSVFVDGKDENDSTAERLTYVKKEVAKTVSNIPMSQVIRTFSGLRPTGNRDDFVIEESEDISDFINVIGIESPGIASAPAISEYVMNEILAKKLLLKQKSEYKKRRPYVKLKEMTREERDLLVKEDPSFGKIICRCEQVTEGEILDVIRRPLGATTVKGIKKRIRPGMGRCQGGFCEPLIVNILAKELNVSPLDILMDGSGSTMLMAETKE